MVEKTQNKSKQEKKKVLIFWLVILMIGVVLLWLWQIRRYNFSLEGGGEQIAPLVDLKNQSVDVYQESSQNIKTIKDKLKEM